MFWYLLGHAVLALHATWVLAVIFGPAWAWRRPRWRLAHLVITALPLIVLVLIGVCPLTTLEGWFWLRWDPRAEIPGEFIARALRRLVYWPVPQGLIAAANAVWLALWASVYFWLGRGSAATRRPLPRWPSRLDGG